MWVGQHFCKIIIEICTVLHSVAIIIIISGINVDNSGDVQTAGANRRIAGIAF